VGTYGVVLKDVTPENVAVVSFWGCKMITSVMADYAPNVNRDWDGHKH